METTVQVAIITASASIIIAALTFYLNKKAERRDSIQQRKLEHYQELLNAISDSANEVTSKKREEAIIRLSRSINTIALVAPKKVIDALMLYVDEIKVSNKSHTTESHDRNLITLLLAIRWSLRLPFKDDPKTFNFHFVKPSRVKIDEKGRLINKD